MTRENEQGYDEPDVSEGGYTVGASAVAWNIDALAPGKSATVSFKVRVTDRAYGRITNQASFGTAFGPVSTSLANTTNMVETAVNKKPQLKVEKTIDAKGKVAAGQIVTYEIKVTNDGIGNAENVEIADILPENVQLVSDSMTTASARRTAIRPSCGMSPASPIAAVPLLCPSRRASWIPSVPATM